MGKSESEIGVIPFLCLAITELFHWNMSNFSIFKTTNPFFFGGGGGIACSDIAGNPAE